MTTQSSRVFFGLACAAVLTATMPAARAEPPVRPAATRVLLLPTLDETGDRSDSVPARAAAVAEQLRGEFLRRGFPCAASGTEDAPASAARDGAALEKLGRAAGANWVVSLETLDMRAQTRWPVFFVRQGRARVHLRVWDVAAHHLIEDDFGEAAKTKTSPLDRTSPAQLSRQALEEAVRQSLAPLLSSYPTTPIPSLPKAVTVTPPPSLGLIPAGTTTPVLRERAEVVVALKSRLSARTARPGAPVVFAVTDPVYSTDTSKTLMLPRGAVATGRVRAVTPRLLLSCESVTDIRGRKVPLRALRLGAPGKAGVMTAAGTNYTLFVDRDHFLTPPKKRATGMAMLP